MPPGRTAETPTKKNSVLTSWRPSNITKGKTKDDEKEKLVVSPVAVQTQGERGKFIEDISSSEGPREQNKLKKK
jgi:hypothetical protein